MPKSNAQSAEPTVAASPGPSGDATPARLLEAAASLIAERGWGSISTRAVAERAGVNQALVHYHFGSMDALRREALLMKLEPVLRGLAEELLDDRPFPDGVDRVMQALDDFDLTSETGVLMAEALLQATRDERIAEAVGGAIGSWTAMLEPRIETAQDRGVVRADVDARALARILAATIDGFLVQRMADREADSAEVAATLNRLLAPIREARP